VRSSKHLHRHEWENCDYSYLNGSMRTLMEFAMGTAHGGCLQIRIAGYEDETGS
jgi:hypothetical protein